MRNIIIPFLAAMTLTACGGSDSTEDTGVVAPESPTATSLETCSNVSLSAGRIAAAARTTLGTELIFTQALAVYRIPVTEGQEVTADLTVPDDKDYNMAFFNSSGSLLACTDTEGNGVDETLDYEVSGVTEIWVKVWTPALPSDSAFSLIVSVPPVAIEVAEAEPNDTAATAQLVSESFTFVNGTLDTDASDSDDYFKHTVSEGDVVEITASSTDDGASLIYIALVDADDNVLSEGDTELSYYFTEEAPSTTLTYTVPAATTEIFVWMAAIPGVASYSVQVQVK